MTINWENITVTDNSPELPDFDLCFELHDGWMDDTQANASLPDSDDYEDDIDVVIDSDDDIDFDDIDFDEPSESDLEAIEAGDVVWID